MIKVNCQECGKEFEAERKSAKFCSANCRVKFNGKVGNPNQPQKEAQQEPETEKAVESTQNELEGVNGDYKPAFVEKEIIDELVAKYSLTTEEQYGSKLLAGSYTKNELKSPKQLVGDSNSKFDQLLKQFNSLVDLTDKPKDIKLKLEQIKETAKNSNLTPRQTDAIIDRCNNQLENKYNTSKHSLKLS